VNWYFMAKGSASDERKGPVPHLQFVAMVQQGKVPLTTLACSPELTGGQWLVVKDIPVIRKALESATAEKSRAQEEQRRAAEVPPPKMVAPPAQASDPYIAPVASQPLIQTRPQPSLHVRPVFQFYWMPDYLQVIWYLTLSLCGLWFLIVLATSLIAASYAERIDGALLVSLAIPTFFTLLGIVVTVTSVRFVLELYAIFFDIRSFMKRQTDLMEQRMAKEPVL
jgi:hypothetical protein